MHLDMEIIVSGKHFYDIDNRTFKREAKIVGSGYSTAH